MAISDTIAAQRIRPPSVNIKVVGVGGGGSNAVTRMYRSRIPGVEYIVANTDAQALAQAEASLRLRVGDRIAGAMGVGGNPGMGRACFEDDREEIKEVLAGADLVFIAAGMGGGTGTGGAPVVARIAKQELGCLTVGVVTKPFPFEGHKRDLQALKGLNRLAPEVDTLIVVPNERLLMTAESTMPIAMAFRMADEVLRQAMQSITELLILPGEINLDFADLRSVMRDAGPAWMAIGRGTGIKRVDGALESALNSPLLEVKIDGATGVLLNITGGSDLLLAEVRKISETVKSRVHKDADIIFGTARDFKMDDEVKITIIATGFRMDKGIDHYDRMEEDGDPDRSGDDGKTDADDEGLGIEMPAFLRAHASADTQTSETQSDDE